MSKPKKLTECDYIINELESLRSQAEEIQGRVIKLLCELDRSIKNIERINK